MWGGVGIHEILVIDGSVQLTVFKISEFSYKLLKKKKFYLNKDVHGLLKIFFVLCNKKKQSDLFFNFFDDTFNKTCKDFVYCQVGRSTLSLLVWYCALLDKKRNNILLDKM